MTFLIDTHIFLWFISGDSRLSATAKKEIENSDNVIYISIASIWEIAIKNSLGKLEIEGGFERISYDLSNNITILQI